MRRREGAQQLIPELIPYSSMPTSSFVNGRGKWRSLVELNGASWSNHLAHEAGTDRRHRPNGRYAGLRLILVNAVVSIDDLSAIVNLEW
jgi:hypothetical protein